MAAIIAVISWKAKAPETTIPSTEVASWGDLEEVKMPKSVPDYIIRYQPMTVSFNRETHQPNWVAWELTREETEGEISRDKAAGFSADPNVPGCPSPSDYTHSGYDRGHMAPAGDMKWKQSAINQSFYMTNICPQAGELNRGAWKKLEENCRQKAAADSAIVIVCGPIFTPGVDHETIGYDTRIPVPDKFFKVILSAYADPPTAIGFIMPNSYVTGGMQTCAVSVDSVEAVTGYDFFSALPDDVENTLEAQCDFPRWSVIRRKK